MSADRVTAEVRALADMGLESLRAEWRRRWGASPKLRSPELLRCMLAWKIQCEALGGPDAELRRDLRRGGGPKAGRLTPGTRLAREWRGVRCEVEVVDGGIRYEGQLHASLSAVAGAIPGAKWNGRRFFGLDKVAT